MLWPSSGRCWHLREKLAQRHDARLVRHKCNSSTAAKACLAALFQALIIYLISCQGKREFGLVLAWGFAAIVFCACDVSLHLPAFVIYKSVLHSPHNIRAPTYGIQLILWRGFINSDVYVLRATAGLCHNSLRLEGDLPTSAGKTRAAAFSSRLSRNGNPETSML